MSTAAAKGEAAARALRDLLRSDAPLALVSVPVRSAAMAAVLSQWGCAAKGVVFCSPPYIRQWPPWKERNGSIMNLDTFNRVTHGPHPQRGAELRVDDMCLAAHADLTR
eukprot:gene40839-30901_t